MKENTPQCIGIILDGNRRWAKKHNLPTYEGHKEGLGNLDKAVGWVREADVKHLAIYVLSTENWNRSEEEVTYLMKLFRGAINDAFKRIIDEGARVHFVGDLSRFPEDLEQNMRKLEKDSATNDNFHLWVCASYGGRLEIIEAARKLQESGTEISEESFRDNMWSAKMPNPDIIIRTGGEKRLSNFLLWQAAYAELFFTDTYWPAFTEEELEEILQEYATRERRHGK